MICVMRTFYQKRQYAHIFEPTSKPVMSLSNGLVGYPMIYTIRVARQSCWRDYIMNVFRVGNVNVGNADPSTMLRTSLRFLQLNHQVVLS